MFLIKVNIQLNNNIRKEPIKGNTYRPLVIFSDKLIRSGNLILNDGEILEMGNSYENRIIGIYFHNDLKVNDEFFVGRDFSLSEGSNIVGRGCIVEVIGEK